MPMADVIVPNQFELSQFAEMPIETLEDAVTACQKAMAKGPKMVLVKHLYCLSDSEFSMMLATPEGCYLAQRPQFDFERQPVGVGDLISALFTAGLAKGFSATQAFAHCHNAVYGVLKETHDRNEWELQTIAAQQELVHPSASYAVEKIS